MRRVGWDLCGLPLDSWHFFNGRTPWLVLEALSAEQIALLQLNDSLSPIGTDLRYERRFRRALIGSGNTDVQRFVATVRGLGFQGVVSPEALSLELLHEAPVDVGTTLMASLEQYWPGAG